MNQINEDFKRLKIKRSVSFQMDCFPTLRFWRLFHVKKWCVWPSASGGSSTIFATHCLPKWRCFFFFKSRIEANCHSPVRLEPHLVLLNPQWGFQAGSNLRLPFRVMLGHFFSENSCSNAFSMKLYVLAQRTCFVSCLFRAEHGKSPFSIAI